VKMLKNLGLAMVAVSLLAIPAAARNGQKGAHNNNGAGEPRGTARAEEVQNKKGDKDKSPSKGSKSKGRKTRTREGWEKNAEHNANAKGHSK
jgi:hypothetical protein